MMPQTMTSRGDRLIWLTQFQEMIFIFVNGPQTFQGIWKYCLWSSLLKTTTFLCFSPKFVCMAARNSQIFHFWGVRVISVMGEWGWVFISYWPLLLFLTCYKPICVLKFILENIWWLQSTLEPHKLWNTFLSSTLLLLHPLISGHHVKCDFGLLQISDNC